MSQPTAPVVLIAEFTARPGNGDEVAALPAGLAENVRREEGNMTFDCYRKADDEDKFVVYEIYRDQAAFEAHIGADYGAVFNQRLQQLIVEPHSFLTFLRPLSG
ncbi:antibiotic biosynthesis monooxygenase [Devosia soli]|uniref:Antibiotic biosynthesis monooxygenase n=1 Tax=Devosia soli TaxID=361041 RepID=A0A0F5L7E1_9HYPH|nr:putative quinol monooxygenase [Devosia soli]KKB78119.1 antibiotic biosynthesis monooxygenase [Devosia soli]